eukprot:12801881-Alexandrium_andersonii.AAC.1
MAAAAGPTGTASQSGGSCPAASKATASAGHSGPSHGSAQSPASNPASRHLESDAQFHIGAAQ